MLSLFDTEFTGFPKKPRFDNTPEYCDSNILNEPHEIFVWASNTEGISGSGSARTAVQSFGVPQGHSMGMCNRTYAIITKDFNTYGQPGYRDKMLKLIDLQVQTLYEYAKFRPELHFYVTKIGCNLAGFTMDDIASIFDKYHHLQPENIILPVEFKMMF